VISVGIDLAIDSCGKGQKHAVVLSMPPLSNFRRYERDRLAQMLLEIPSIGQLTSPFHMNDDNRPS